MLSIPQGPSRFAVLTSVETRHRFVARALCQALPVVAVGYERTGYSPAQTSLDHGLGDAERHVVQAHFEERARQEERFFGHDAAWVQPSAAHEVLRIEPGKLNSDATLRFLESRGVDAVLVYGTNLIKPPLLDRFAGRMINLHLGLSPYYRGTATNFYPLLNEEPEYVGATIHLIDAGIDSGAIIHHARPVITADDMPHTIGCKAILSGLERLVRAARSLAAGRMSSVPQWSVPNPRVYLRKDFHPSHVVELYRKLADGLIPRYVTRAQQAIGRVRIVD